MNSLDVLYQTTSVACSEGTTGTSKGPFSTVSKFVFNYPEFVNAGVVTKAAFVLLYDFRPLRIFYLIRSMSVLHVLVYCSIIFAAKFTQFTTVLLANAGSLTVLKEQPTALQYRRKDSLGS